MIFVGVGPVAEFRFRISLEASKQVRWRRHPLQQHRWRMLGFGRILQPGSGFMIGFFLKRLKGYIWYIGYIRILDRKARWKAKVAILVCLRQSQTYDFFSNFKRTVVVVCGVKPRCRSHGQQTLAAPPRWRCHDFVATLGGLNSMLLFIKRWPSKDTQKNTKNRVGFSRTPNYRDSLIMFDPSLSA